MKTYELPNGKVNVVADKEAVAEASAEAFVRIAAEAIKVRGSMTVALSGGSTPAGLYKRLSDPKWANQVDWANVHFYLSDERCVSHDSPDSNYGLAQRELFANVLVPMGNIHPTQDQEVDAAQSAVEYESLIRREFSERDGHPIFDLIFLGMGPDGHCASLFPGTAALAETQRLVVANWVQKLNSTRITFTYTLLNAARNVIFMVAGADKSPVFAEIVSGHNKDFPAAKVYPTAGQLSWFVEEAAAAGLLKTVS